MSGWIKWEKDLATDPRVLRMASRLSHGDVTQLSRSRLTVLGALVVFWGFADTHIRDDDTIECSIEEINEVVGIANFCELLPADWLEIFDSNCVHLPDFLKHNGIEGKKKALAAKRQERHRKKGNAKVTLKSRRTNAESVTEASLDQDQDQDHKTEPARLNGKGYAKSRSKGPIPEDFCLSDPMRQQALKRYPDADVDEMFTQFAAHHRSHGKEMKSWEAAWTTWLGNARQFGYPKSPTSPGGSKEIRWA